MAEEQDTQPTIFEDQAIRRVWHEEEWWYSVVDVVAVFASAGRARKYWSDLKNKLVQEGFTQLSDEIGQLKMKASDGKNRSTDVARATTLFRIIQSISSPKAEPFKQWLATVGKQRIDELENPELAIERMRDDYRKLGYPEDWIATRLQSISVRKALTGEWERRGVEQGHQYSILTAEIARKTFGLNPSDHKTHKGLKRENLRDHMTPLELAFTIIGETSTTMKAQDKDAIGFDENRTAATEGGAAAGKAREAFEQESGQRVVSSENVDCTLIA